MNGSASGTSRRVFLGRAAGTAAAVAGASVGAGAIARSAGAADQRSYTAGRFALDIDAGPSGRLAGVDGGRLEGNVVVEDQVPGELFRHKHVAGVKYEDFTLQVGAGMGKGMYDWIKSSFDKGRDQRRASVISYDSSGNEKSRHGASQAYISSVTVPVLDRSSKEPAYLAVDLTCPKVTPLPSQGTLFQAAGKQKAWLCSNFVFEVNGLDTSRVASIDSFTWKCGIAADGSTLLDVSDIGVTFPRADGASWHQWLDSMVNLADDARDGALTLIGANGGAVVTFAFSSLGLYRLSPVPGSTKEIKAEMYCERVTWDLKKGTK
jgi:hypothetical protein